MRRLSSSVGSRQKRRNWSFLLSRGMTKIFPKVPQFSKSRQLTHPPPPHTHTHTHRTTTTTFSYFIHPAFPYRSTFPHLFSKNHSRVNIVNIVLLIFLVVWKILVFLIGIDILINVIHFTKIKSQWYLSCEFYKPKPWLPRKGKVIVTS